jgi:hypothetical protein
MRAFARSHRFRRLSHSVSVFLLVVRSSLLAVVSVVSVCCGDGPTSATPGTVTRVTGRMTPGIESGTGPKCRGAAGHDNALGGRFTQFRLRIGRSKRALGLATAAHR